MKIKRSIFKKLYGESQNWKIATRPMQQVLATEAKQRRIIEVLRQTNFQKGFNPLKLRHNER